MSFHRSRHPYPGIQKQLEVLIQKPGVQLLLYGFPVRLLVSGSHSACQGLCGARVNPQGRTYSSKGFSPPAKAGRSGCNVVAYDASPHIPVSSPTAIMTYHTLLFNIICR